MSFVGKDSQWREFDLHMGHTKFFSLLNQQSEYKVFYKVMCWLAGSLVDSLTW
jgi:hypothetical protein